MKTRYLSMIMLIALGLFSCEKDSDSSSTSSSSTNNNSSGGSIAGTYTGEEIITYTEKSSSMVVQIDTFSSVYTIKAAGSGFQLEYLENGTTSHLLDLTVSGNSFTASGPANHPWYGGETYSATISGDRLNMNYTGEEDDNGTIYTYTGSFIGDRPPTTGGGSGGGTGGGGTGGGGTSGDYLSVSSSSAGAKLRANCDGDFDAAFVGTTSGEEWLLSLFHFNTCADKLGTLTVNSGANSVNEISLELWLVDVNGDPMITLDSEDNSGTMTVSQVGTKMKYEATNLTLDDGSGNNYTVSFRVTEI